MSWFPKRSEFSCNKTVSPALCHIPRNNREENMAAALDALITLLSNRHMNNSLKVCVDPLEQYRAFREQKNDS